MNFDLEFVASELQHLRLWLTYVEVWAKMMRHEISKFPEETQGVEGPLSEPHFDDEATLLSARRVVPFHKLTAQENFKWKLLFGTALAAALMMGIVGGVIYARLERMPASRAETTETAAQALPENDHETSSKQEDEELSSVPDESTALAVNKSAQKTVDKPRNRSTISKNPAAPNPSPTQQAQTEQDDSDYYWNERAIRRAERRATRRARREAARETQRSDDLFRIQEIFEGSSRP